MEKESRVDRNSKKKTTNETKNKHKLDKEVEKKLKEQGYGYMCTAQEMYDYARENKLGFNLTPFIGKWLQLKHFELIEEELGDNEEVLISFIGRHLHFHNDISMNPKENINKNKHNSDKVKYFKAEGFFAYAITTDARLIYAHWKPFRANTMSIPLSNLNNVNPVTSFFWGHVKIETFGDTFCVLWTKNTVRRINKALHKGVTDSRDGSMGNIIQQRRNSPFKSVDENTSSGSVSPVEKLAEMKKALDNGLITQEEYDAYKKKVLEN